jgi:hypothetical protein
MCECYRMKQVFREGKTTERRKETSHDYEGDSYGIQHHDAHERTASECIAGSLSLREFCVFLLSLQALQSSLYPVSYGRGTFACEAKHFWDERGRGQVIRTLHIVRSARTRVRIRFQIPLSAQGR